MYRMSRVWAKPVLAERTLRRVIKIGAQNFQVVEQVKLRRKFLQSGLPFRA